MAAMNNRDLRWRYFRQEELPEVLFGLLQEPQFFSPYFDSAELRGGKVAVGFHDRERGYMPPSVLVLSEKGAAETFSWLSTYAAETFPLSQFARVVVEDDWRRFEKSAPTIGRRAREDRWSSVVLGELLAQGEVASDLSALPLSRAAGCFSSCIARSMIVHHGRQDVTRLTVERLRSLEADARFVRRPLGIGHLVPIWALASADLEEPIPPAEAADLVVRSAWNELSKNESRAQIHPARLREADGLYSDSVEARVISFNQLAEELLGTSSDAPAHLVPIMLAAAAFLVGRGTSHVFLLRKFDALPSSAFAWFGLMASLTGVQSWDMAWSRITKGIERQLRTRFDWSDASSSDLYWAEYAWLSKTHSGPTTFAGIPKALSSAVSVEVVPGASCQFRLGPGSQPAGEQKRLEARARPSEHEKHLEFLLGQFVTLASRVQQVLDPSGKPGQRSFDLEGDRGNSSRTKRGRRE